MTILIIGQPGAGKTTWARKNLGDGLCYDLDAISAALRLAEPKANDTPASRGTANDLLPAFLKAALQRCERVLVIRAAPSLSEIRSIRPDRLIYCRSTYWPKIPSAEVNMMQSRLRDAMTWAYDHDVPMEYAVEDG